MRYCIWRSLLPGGVVALAALVTVLSSSSQGSGPAAAKENGDLYRAQCARCHGAGGRGDGPDADLFAKRPSDLCTGIAGQTTQALVARILDGQRLSPVLDLLMLRARAADVEFLIAYMRRLPEVDWRRADAGSALYRQRCQVCHGAYGRPPGALPPGVRPPRDLADPAYQRSLSADELVVVVQHGRAGMPALTPRLSEEEAREVAAYVRLFSPGFQTYTQYCADCHGDHGVPEGSFGEAHAAPTAVFDRAYFARHDPDTLRTSVWHMLDAHEPSMPHFRGTLRDRDARVIVEYLRKSCSPGPQ